MPTTDAASIIRDLARRGPSIHPEYGPGTGDASGWVGWRCRWCFVRDSRIELASDSAIYRPDFHAAGCLWRRAVDASGQVYVPPAMAAASDDGRREA